ncbi:MAG: hypothetical protein ACOCZQ_00705 [Nanoarchaeota archaeon]
MEKKRITSSLKKTSRSMLQMLPIMLGLLFLLGAVKALIPPQTYSDFFGNHMLLDSFTGASIGSIMAGNAATSYVLGGELLDEGVGLLPVTAFLIAWVTVGVVQLPAEAIYFGKRFSVTRNLVCFFCAIVISILIFWTMGVLA